MPAIEINDVAGDSWYGLWTPTGGSGILLSGYVTKFDWGTDTDTEKNTAAGFVLGTEQAIRSKIAPKMTIAYRDSVAGAALRASLYEKQKGQLTTGPEGSGTGKPKYTAMLQVKKANAPIEVGKLIMIEVEFVNIGSDWVHHPSYSDTF